MLPVPLAPRVPVSGAPPLLAVLPLAPRLRVSGALLLAALSVPLEAVPVPRASRLLPLPVVPLPAVLRPAAVLSVVALVPEPYVPDAVVELPDVWAMDTPPIARAAAAASIVKVLWVVFIV